MFRLSLLSSAVGLALLAGRLAVQAAPSQIFAHFIVGIVQTYNQSMWENDIQLAKETGFDGFALDIGTDNYTDEQLGYAFAAANAVGGFSLFISFDFGASPGFDDYETEIVPRLNNWTTNPAYTRYNNSALVSTFVGDGFNWAPVKAAVTGTNLSIIPFYQPASTDMSTDDIDGLFNWDAWPETSSGGPVNANMTNQTDYTYQLDLEGYPYMAPTSAWFFTHYSPSSYNKNWIFLSDTLLITRLNMLQAINPDLIEFITWNDFGESHYIGPLHPDDPNVYAPGGESPGAIDWVTGMPHDAWRDIVKLYIPALKAGTAPNVTDEEVVYWYRPNPNTATCTNDTTGAPEGSTYPQNYVFAATMLSSPATLTITGGQGTTWTYDNVPAGVNQYAGPFEDGQPTFTITRNNATVMSGQGGLSISSSCLKYNFNAYVGSVLPS